MDGFLDGPTVGKIIRPPPLPGLNLVQGGLIHALGCLIWALGDLIFTLRDLS